ncbi:hypothetical protein J5U23_01414 [Saccharolobus shibatae B12]|uniref:PIG-L family deacetylase n=1 Tax=Saccharolobus shibatae (strain ATCC 51178 / DSM 5389 / JCM 8931 / NBRC 15437 / B12) TaxID=523848 RepID=A0A8F5GT53_SACSH|nr:PIG-L family deacetylase [Saccharolobus shibatae]QXJ28545.1 hypothetical protein J5U23_01414 [Saccharolobus shibatae B12]
MILIIAPHPDDDIICCGGIISRNAYNVKVIYITDGSKGSPRHEEWGKELALRRMREAYNALSKLGIKNKDNIIFLGNEDGSVSRNFNKIRNQLLNLLQESRITEIYFPSPFDIHPDHSAIGKIVLSTIKEMSERRMSLYMYTIHRHSIVDVRNLPTVLRSLFLQLKIMLNWKYVCLKVDNPRLKVEALEFHESQVWYMSKKVKELTAKDYECFYFKRI